MVRIRAVFCSLLLFFDTNFFWDIPMLCIYYEALLLRYPLWFYASVLSWHFHYLILLCTYGNAPVFSWRIDFGLGIRKLQCVLDYVRMFTTWALKNWNDIVLNGKKKKKLFSPCMRFGVGAESDIYPGKENAGIKFEENDYISAAEEADFVCLLHMLLHYLNESCSFFIKKRFRFRFRSITRSN